ncbi:integumentary mucin C.1-like [Haliotis rubra]|uniref:integumentary mucin C.1-like n=1 Tax=Haliotis rubra TaxID=36100 RepID=UPI001EE50A6A|nr:integumentary mucin C.1-like [Haliotis rubra]
MQTLVVQLLTFYSVYRCITCHGQDVFLTRVTPSSLVCDSLCTYTTRCGSYFWDAATGSCHLHAGRDTGSSRWGRLLVQYQATPRKDMCGSRVCGIHQICVPVEAGSTHICLGMTLGTTASTASTTSVTTSSTETSAFNVPSTSPATPVTTTLATPSQSTAAQSTPTATTTEALTTTNSPTTAVATTPGVSSVATTSTTVPTTSTDVPTTSTSVPTTSTHAPTTSTPVPTTSTATSTVTTTSTSSTSTSTTTTTTTPMTTMTYDCAVTSLSVNNNECGTYIGCYFDDWGRVLPYGHLVDRSTMTSEKCMLNCYGNYSHFGIEDGTECFCGNEIKSGYSKKGDNECPKTCPGDSGSRCGGPWRISIYMIVP